MLHSIIQNADKKNMALFARIAKKIKIILIQKTVSNFFSLITATLLTSLVSFGKCVDFKIC